MDGNQPQPLDVPPRRLYREPEEKKLTGLCGGIADYVSLDPTLIRLAAVVFVLATPVTIVAYLIAAVVVPVRPAHVPRQRTGHTRLGDFTPHLLGLVALALFVGLIDREWWFDVEAPVIGMALLGLGVWLLLSNRREPAPPAPPTPPGPAGPTGPTQPAGPTGRFAGPTGPTPSPAGEETGIDRENLATGSDESTTLLGEVEPERALVGPPASESTSGTTLHKTEDGTPSAPVPPDPASFVPDDSAHSAGPQGEVPPPVPPWGLGTPPAGGSVASGSAVADPTVPGSPGPPGSFDWFATSSTSTSSTTTTATGATGVGGDRRRPGGLRLPAVFLGLLLVGAGVLALLTVSGAVDLDADVALAAVLVALGAALVVGAWWGRARSLIVLGVPVLGLLVFSERADLPLDAGTGDRTVVIDRASELTERHDLLAGQLTLDLRDMPRVHRQIPTIRSEVGFGSLVVTLPDDVAADADTLVGIGEVHSPWLDGGDEDGVHVTREISVPGREGAGRVRLDLNVGVGVIEVNRG